MKPIASTHIPEGKEWLYEVKYDGFRCVLHWGNDIKLISQNNTDLTGNFPEIVAYCKQHTETIASLLPLSLDGELVVLNSPFQANFSWIQKRGRLKNTNVIQTTATERPATLMIFDLLQQKGSNCFHKPFITRKLMLKELFTYLQPQHSAPLQFVKTYENPNLLWETIFAYKAEGMIAKRKKSSYIAGKSHRDWFKIKNWRTIYGILSAYDTKNDYFSVSVYSDDNLISIGKCKHGLSKHAYQTAKQFFLSNGKKDGESYLLPPAICASIHTLDLYKSELREPEFHQLELAMKPEVCTTDKLALDLTMLPTSLTISKVNKVYWPKPAITKGEHIRYMREIAPYMLPFLKDRALTLIRCPEGVEKDFFFQKHLPPYAPEFVNSVEKDGEQVIICDSLDGLIWFANHGGIEYHVPFQQVNKETPAEIVFDLDPPNRSKFDWAIQAALLIKRLIDNLELTSFVKTSGNKGLQIYIPIPERSMTYAQTAIFTQAIAWTVEQARPELFTTERMKNKRKGRLYIDYVQHGKDKTIIAPYSPRKTNEGTVATPLFWSEIKEGLRPEAFTIRNVVERVKEQGCPFKNYFEVKETQRLNNILRLIQ